MAGITIWRFKKKPIEVRAVLFDGTEQCAKGIVTAWPRRAILMSATRGHSLAVFTTGGTVIAAPGDWIVVDSEGEVFPMKPSAFEDMYELVE